MLAACTQAPPAPRKKEEKKYGKMGKGGRGVPTPLPRRDRHHTSFFNRVVLKMVVFGKHTLRVAYFPI